MMKLFGRDVHHMGRNKDIDLEELLEQDFPIHAVIRINKQADTMRNQAAACHASQLSPGGGPRRGGLLGLMNRILGPRDHYTRVYPPVKGRVHEHDLFKGVK
jgi:hypothetical protein